MFRDREYLTDILAAARLVLGYVAKKSEAQFLGDVQCQDAVIRRLEVIGEASRRISAETRQRLPEVPWQSMIGMRNVMIHEYDDVDLKIVWDTAQQFIPRLLDILDKEFPEEGDP